MTLKRICVFCGAAIGNRPEYRDAAVALGRTLAERGIGLVYGGGAIGMMGAVSDAVLEAGGEVIGIIPHGLLAREAGERGRIDLRVVATMHERKAMMAELSDGFAVLPGGFGTLEEVVEVLTWLQLGIHRKPAVFIDTLGYWQPLLKAFDHMLDEGFLRGDTRELAQVAPDAGGALDKLARFQPPVVPRWLLPGEE
ncbi:MAG: TIGR00730 family Rossman fold protein [Pseudomonadota bacterium]